MFVCSMNRRAHGAIDDRISILSLALANSVTGLESGDAREGKDLTTMERRVTGGAKFYYH
jgi:hypothetical protein